MCIKPGGMREKNNNIRTEFWRVSPVIAQWARRDSVDVFLGVLDEIRRSNDKELRGPIFRGHFDMLKIVVVSADVSLHTVLLEQREELVDQALSRSVLGHTVHGIVAAHDDVVRPEWEKPKEILSKKLKNQEIHW